MMPNGKLMLCLLMVAVAAGCGQSEPLERTRLGEPLVGMSAPDLSLFHAGRTVFNRIFTPADGLGPLFNDNQCSACHTSPATGGTGDQFVMRVSRFDATTARCDALTEAGGENVRIQATPQLQSLGVSRQPVPVGATDTVRFNVPFIFGMGLIEAVPEAQVAAHADPEDRNEDGISGRAGRDAQGRLARFGRKAEHATLRDFIEHAAHFEMGLTTPARPQESSIAGVPFPDGVDSASDPELSDEEIELLAHFLRFLAPAHRRDGASDQDRETIARGEELFHAVGCTGCHVPSMTTARSDVPALDRKRIDLYSDLLLHDMGPGLATVCSPGTGVTELRTEPLMGLGRRGLYLHDSRTNDLREAIMTHGGEAAIVRERFNALPELQQHDLIRFLRSL